jgi:hypothetical protein
MDDFSNFDPDLDKAVAHLMRARGEMERAAEALESARLRECGDARARLAMLAEVAATQGELARCLAGAVTAAPDETMDLLLAGLAHPGGGARPRNH